MPHAHTARVLEAWRLRRPPGARLPGRTALSPVLFGPLLPQMFVLAEEAGEWRLRTVGALLHDLHGRLLAGEAFADLWTAADRAQVRRLLTAARGLGAPRVVAARGETARGGVAALEITLAPVAGPRGEPDRCLGLYQPLTPLVRLAGDPLATLHLSATPDPAPGPRLVVDNGRTRP